MKYRYWDEEDCSKRVLTKASIAKELNRQNVIRLIIFACAVFPMLIIWWVFSISSYEILGIPVIITGGMITLVAVYAFVYSMVQYVILSGGKFTVDTDTVLNTDMGDAPSHLKPSRRDTGTINDVYALLCFYEYGWVKTDVEGYKLADKDDEYYIVVSEGKKKKAIWAYCKKFYEYKE